MTSSRPSQRSIELLTVVAVSLLVAAASILPAHRSDAAPAPRPSAVDSRPLPLEVAQADDPDGPRRIVIDPGEGFPRIPLAHPRWQVEGCFASPTATEAALNELLVQDLELSGFFEGLPQNRYLSSAAGVSDPNLIDFPSWRLIGADTLVTGTVSGTAGGKCSVELRFFDVPKAGQVVGRRYEVDSNDAHRAVHDFANRVLEAATGTPGSFGTKLSFVTNRGQRRDRKEIFVIDADGRNLTAVTRNNTLNLLPEWSPDGGSLVYTSYKRGNPDLWITDITSGASRTLATGGLNTGGSFSPDGSRIVFSHEGDIFVIGTDGTGRRRVTSGPAHDFSPSWSPDGRRIAYASDGPGRPHLYVVNSDGTGSTRITFGRMDHQSPAFSPDGRKIAFEGREPGSGYRLYTINPDGRSLRRITNGPGTDEHPSWSPDGRTLAFSSTREGSSSLYLVSALGGRVVRVTDGGGEDGQPAWGPLPRTRSAQGSVRFRETARADSSVDAARDSR